MFAVGETVQVWDWIFVGCGDEDDKLGSHGATGVIARPSSANDIHRGNRLGKRAADCFQVAIPNKGLVHVHTEWLRKFDCETNKD